MYACVCISVRACGCGCTCVNVRVCVCMSVYVSASVSFYARFVVCCCTCTDHVGTTVTSGAPHVSIEQGGMRNRRGVNHGRVLCDRSIYTYI